MTSPRFRRPVCAFTLVLWLPLAACTHAGSGGSSSLEQSFAPATAEPQLSTRHRPIVALPGEAGRVVALRSRDDPDGLRQDVRLDGGAVRDVRNGLTIVAGASGRNAPDVAVRLDKPTEAMIRSEIGAAFPHIPMRVVERPSANAYGPYGLALGRVGPDVRCLYMWQWIDANRLPAEAGVDGPVSIRVRLCRSATTLDAMAAMMDRISIATASAEAVDDDAASSSADAGRPFAKATPPRARMARTHRSSGVKVAEPEASAERRAVRAPASPIRPAVVVTAPALVSSDLPPEAFRGPKVAASN